MSYCTIADLTSRKGTRYIAQLTGDASGNTVDNTKAQLAIDTFAERMNTAIRRRYPDLPFDATNKYLNGLNVEGAYLLLNQDSPTGMDEGQRADWSNLLKELDRIGEGKVDLRSDTEDEEEAATKGFFTANKRLFNRNSLNGVDA